MVIGYRILGGSRSFMDAIWGSLRYDASMVHLLKGAIGDEGCSGRVLRFTCVKLSMTAPGFA